MFVIGPLYHKKKFKTLGDGEVSKNFDFLFSPSLTKLKYQYLGHFLRYRPPHGVQNDHKPHVMLDASQFQSPISITKKDIVILSSNPSAARCERILEQLTWHFSVLGIFPA